MQGGKSVKNDSKIIARANVNEQRLSLLLFLSHFAFANKEKVPNGASLART